MTSLPRVFITQAIDPAATQRLSAAAEVHAWDGPSAPPYEVIAEEAKRADALLTMLCDRIDAALITAAAPRLRVIAQMAVGYDNIAVSTATQLGIPVGNTPGVLTETTADLAWALLMAAARRVVEADGEVHEHIWRPWGPNVLTGADVYGATLGIIGFGRIGQAMARRAQGFGMRILYSSPQPKPEAAASLSAAYLPLPELLAQADYVSLHAYLTPATYHLMGREQFAMMKPGAILINTARGGMVDPSALLDALQSGHLSAAGLDVTEPEPIPTDSPLLGMKNVVITPHIGSASRATRVKMAQMTVDNLLAALQHQPMPYCANPQVYIKG